ncbi:hypothetical protein F5984_18055 [Rudanella paleaurantiibacter]|uniref:Transposase IS200-like domain-containing protein n=1 Tax=Rudanella paleaurantiibacter TaxID=2614655 RepID=A0A7J5TWD1_9BACT|nr:transposase [Rudanella paleaurantiibacter]KAB7728733.1 hypothetical protein F5984_18055 [Rudanella paleaurantiibacter]
MNDKYSSPFEPDAFYHVYARSNNGETLFLTDENRTFFLLKLERYIGQIATVYAYCLMDNHVHFMIKLKAKEELTSKLADKGLGVNEAVSQLFRKFFISYSASFNRFYDRKGNLFQRPFRRIHVDTDSYFTALIAYIHCNPTKHLNKNYQTWTWSSYKAMLSNKPTKVARAEVLQWFGGPVDFEKFHKGYSEAYLDERYWLE